MYDVYDVFQGKERIYSGTSLSELARVVEPCLRFSGRKLCLNITHYAVDLSGVVTENSFADVRKDWRSASGPGIPFHDSEKLTGSFSSKSYSLAGVPASGVSSFTEEQLRVLREELDASDI